jgi:hypothetical protein
MRFYLFFSVHERLFHPLMQEMRDRYGATKFGGFVWGEDQQSFLRSSDIRYDPLHVFSRDILAGLDDAPPPDVEALRKRERRYGVPINRMIWSERHLLEGRSYEQVLQLTEAIFRLVEESFDNHRPDCVFSEDVSGLTSYIHYVVARDRGIPFWRISGARMPGLLSIYNAGLQDWNLTHDKFRDLSERELTPAERERAKSFVTSFVEKPQQPTGMKLRRKLPVADQDDVRRWVSTTQRFYRDAGNPTLTSPTRMVAQRATRLGRSYAATALDLFEQPVEGEPYVLYPIHFQPEASTLVQAPYYLDQVSLIEDISKSLPVGYRLYVKEHVSNRGRRPLSFYRRIKDTFGVRLLGPDVDNWALIQNAAAVAVITGTMGWEGILFGRPVVTFGEVFFNMYPDVYRAGRQPKDHWAALFRKAIYHHQHDEEELLKFVSAIQQTSKPGFMANPGTFEQVLEPDNVRHMADALAWGLGLTGREPSSVQARLRQ